MDKNKVKEMMLDDVKRNGAVYFDERFGITLTQFRKYADELGLDQIEEED